MEYFLNIILIEVFENYDNLNIKLFHYSMKNKKTRSGRMITNFFCLIINVSVAEMIKAMSIIIFYFTLVGDEFVTMCCNKLQQ